MFPENVLGDLLAHAEDMADLGESDLGFVSSTEKCENVVKVEKDVAKVTCSKCCATLGMKK